MMVVNLAIAVKSIGNVDEAKKILEGEDWSAASDKFQICVAAVRDDIDAVVDYMPRIAEKDISKDDFRDWPAFQSIRSEPKFIKAFEEKFGEAFMPDRGSTDSGDANIEGRPMLLDSESTPGINPDSGENAVAGNLESKIPSQSK